MPDIHQAAVPFYLSQKISPDSAVMSVPLVTRLPPLVWQLAGGFALRPSSIQLLCVAPIFQKCESGRMLITPALALLALAQASPTAVQSARVVAGPVGICVRWNTDPEHVADAVVVISSGDATVDRRVRENTRSVKLRRPTSSSYKGQWVGMLVATSPVRPKAEVPNCSHLRIPALTS